MSTDRFEPVAILWDIENCGVPHGVNAEDVSLHVQMALKFQLALRGPLTVFSAYGDFAQLPQRTRQGCQKTGVNLIDIPHGTKDAADKAILVDMFLFALDNPPPCTLVLITGDVDFAPALHKLGRRGYSVVLVAPSGRKVSPALLNSCHYLLSWQDIAHRKCTLSMHNVLSQPLHPDNHTFPSIIQYPKKITATCAGTLGNMPSGAVGTAVGSFGAEGSTFLKSEQRDNQISMTVMPNAQVCMGCEVKGSDLCVNHCSNGVGNNPNFGKLETVPQNGAQITCEAPKKIPAEIFVEHVEIPIYAVKESTEIPVMTEVDWSRMGAAEIPVLPSHGMADIAKESQAFPSRSMGTDRNCREAFDMKRSVFQPSCSSACPVFSYGMTGYENTFHVTSQGMKGCIGSSKFIPQGGEPVSNQFAIPNPGGLTGAFGAWKEGFEHSWKGPAYYAEAEDRHHFEGMHHRAGVGPLCGKVGDMQIQCSLPLNRKWDNPCSVPSDFLHTDARGPVAGSGSFQQHFTNFKYIKIAGKQAACAKSKGQDPSLQLKVKKKKMKKTQNMSNVEAAPVAAPKLTKKQRKAARLAAMQASGTQLSNSLEAALPAAAPKLTKKQRKAARLAAMQTPGAELNHSLKAAVAAAPKPTKKLRKSARLAAMQKRGTELNKSLEHNSLQSSLPTSEDVSLMPVINQG